MAKYYYNGVLLQEIPAADYSGYTYQMILKYSDEDIESLWVYASDTKPYHQVKSSVDRLELPGGRTRSIMNAETGEWGSPNVGTSSTWCDLSNTWEVVWSNFNIPSGSASSATVYFYRSSPVPYFDGGYLKTSARAYHAASSTTPMSISVEASAGDMLVIGIAARNEFSVPEGFTKCFTTDPCGTQTLSMVYKLVAEDGLQTVTFPGTEGVLTYLTAMVFRNIKKVKYTGQQYYYFQDAGTSTFSKAIQKRKDGVCTLWGITCNYALNYSESTPYDYSASPDDMEGIQSQDPLLNGVRLKMFFDDGTGAMDHTISYPLKGAYNYAIDAIELYPYDMRYLVKSGSNLYTVTDGALSALNETEITASLFHTYGVDDLPDGNLLMGLTDPEVLYWHDSTDDLPELTMTVTGSPPVPQIVITSTQDMSDPSILGIESATVDASDDVLFAISFDDGVTWKAYDGAKWVTLSTENSGMTKTTMENISLEAWAQVAMSAMYKLRFVLMNAGSYVSAVRINYIN